MGSKHGGNLKKSIDEHTDFHCQREENEKYRKDPNDEAMFR